MQGALMLSMLSRYTPAPAPERLMKIDIANPTLVYILCGGIYPVSVRSGHYMCGEKTTTTKQLWTNICRCVNRPLDIAIHIVYQDAPTMAFRPVNISWGARNESSSAVSGGYRPSSDTLWQIDGLAQDCSNSSALAMELLQSCAKISTYYGIFCQFFFNQFRKQWLIMIRKISSGQWWLNWHHIVRLSVIPTYRYRIFDEIVTGHFPRQKL